MEYMYAALLLHKLGKEINENHLKSIVSAAGGNIDEGKIKSLVASLKGIDIAKELESASLTPVPVASHAGHEKKEEKPKEEKKEAAAEGLSALFG
ncbi:50S ribosomal protein P1 [Candidatus Pacearchaeota archaeon]|nr:50S ribosomal protein P1 [Candidatus Pacearchaeota archaeon]